MPRNVEIKVHVCDLDLVKQRIIDLKKSNSADNETVVLKQEDIFLNLPNDKAGKLKLRKIEGSPQELIYYDRTECPGPKLSSFYKCNVPEELENVLLNALGTWGVVKKHRTLIMVGQTRVHFDCVEGLGNFVELEVVLNENQTVEEGQTIAMNLMSHMGFTESDLLSVSYVDMLRQKDNQS
ncbi:uncharacterized protein LOC126833530 [Adelges cooleyi]|uniref:uncharacterized protein LOC126833530 n=1 Tax=Adelges cooleyi TaxID=133065 RepID=UPI00217FAF5C|nr:uncharacterized protein LOC126833530 [Adelges cooleyi]